MDVRLYAMKTQRPKGPAQRQRNALGHVSTARMRNKCIVAEVCTPKGSAHDLADVDHASERPRHPENDESPFVGRLPQAPDIRTIRGRRAGRWRPVAQEEPAPVEQLPGTSVHRARMVSSAELASRPVLSYFRRHGRVPCTSVAPNCVARRMLRACRVTSGGRVGRPCVSSNPTRARLEGRASVTA